MRIIRAFIVLLSVIALQLGFGLIMLSLVFRFTIGNQATVEQALTQAAVYDGAEEFIAQQLKDQLSENIGGDITNRQLDSIVNGTLTSELLQNEVESALSYLYQWLDEGAPGTVPVFTFDLTPARTQLVENIADYSIERLENLPVCSSPPSTTDPLLINCRPTNVNLEEERDRYVQELLDSDDFLAETTFSSGELFSESDQQSTDMLLSSYRTLQRGVWIGFGGVAFSAVIILAISGSRRHGAGVLARQAIWFGVLGIFSAITLWLVFDNAAPNIGTDQLQSALLDALRQLANRAVMVVAAFSTTIIALGISGAFRISNNKQEL